MSAKPRTLEDLLAAWGDIAPLVAQAADRHWDDHEHPLCPWEIRDTTELPESLAYVADVLICLLEQQELANYQHPEP